MNSTKSMKSLESTNLIQFVRMRKCKLCSRQVLIEQDQTPVCIRLLELIRIEILGRKKKPVKVI